jgi:hypothetical protein
MRSGKPGEAGPKAQGPVDGPLNPDPDPAAHRPWLGLYFKCAGLYTRAYRNAAATGYTGRCPRCGKTVRFAVGEGGSDQRRFEVTCQS